MAWFDSFGKLLTKGCDVVYGVDTVDGVRLESGIIHEITDDHVSMSYNSWKDGDEEVYDVTFNAKDYLSKVIPSIYKIKHV